MQKYWHTEKQLDMKSIHTNSQASSIDQLLQNALNYSPQIQHQYAIVVPCYNEESRFAYEEFKNFAQHHPEVLEQLSGAEFNA